MADWAVASGSRIEAIGVTAGSSNGTSITSGSANTKGAWTQLIASTSFTTSMVIVTAQFPSGTSTLLDIGVGGAGSEIVVIPDMHHACVLANVPIVFSFPLMIPAGSRIAARAAAITASSIANVSVFLVSGGFDAPPPHTLCRAYGVVTADSGGTQVDPGATINTKGAWSQIVASTTMSIRGLMLMVGNQNNAVATAGNMLADIGVGGAGSETILWPDYRLMVSASETLTPQISPLVPVCIPEGSRLAIRAQCTNNDATDRLFDAILYGLA